MNNALKLLYGGLILAVILSLGLTLMTAYQWWQITTVNTAIAHPDNAGKLREHPYVLFALAYKDRRAHPQQALATLTALREQADRQLKPKVLFNRGNIYFQQALALDAKDKKRISLIELAKQDYREALLLNDQLRPARFNLELALHVLPEKDQDASLDKKPKVLNKKTIESYGFRADLP